MKKRLEGEKRRPEIRLRLAGYLSSRERINLIVNATNAKRLLKNLVVCLGTSNKRKEIVFSGAHKVLEKIAVKNLKCMAR